MQATIPDIDRACETRVMNPRISMIPGITGGSQKYVWDTHENLFSTYIHKTSLTSTNVDSFESTNHTKFHNLKFGFTGLENMLLLLEAYNAEIKKFGTPKGFDKIFFKKEFINTAIKIAQLNFDKVAIEGISDKGFRFTLGFSNGRMLLIDKNINYDVFNKDEIIFSFFVNRELIASNAADINEFIPSFKKYLIS